MPRPTYPSDLVDKTLVRFPVGMMPRLKEDAARAHRSMNKQIIFLLERALRSATATTGEGLDNSPPAVAPDSTALQGGPIHQRS